MYAALSSGGRAPLVRSFPVLIALLSVVCAALGCNLSFSVPTAPDARPLVVFIAPENNSQIAEGASVQLAARAEDPAGVARIDFVVDDQPLGSQNAPDLQRTTYTALQVWLANGVRGHLLTAMAYRADNTMIGSANLTVNVLPVPSGIIPLIPSNTLVGGADLATVVVVTPSAATQIPTANAATLPPVAPSTTPLPSAPPSPQVTTTAIISNDPTARITTAFLNVRAGPGPTYQSLGQVRAGDVVAILARNEDRTWWAIQAPSGLRGWILNNPAYIVVSGSTANVQLGAAKPSPTP